MEAKTTRPSITAASWVSWSPEMVSAWTVCGRADVIITFQRTRADPGFRASGAVQLFPCQRQVGDVVDRRVGQPGAGLTQKPLKR
jgi:hypothetical protein